MGVETSTSRCATRRFMQAIMPWKATGVRVPAGARRSAAKAEPKGPARAVVRMARGGKDVTVVEQLELRPEKGVQALAHGRSCPISTAPPC